MGKLPPLAALLACLLLALSCASRGEAAGAPPGFRELGSGSAGIGSLRRLDPYPLWELRSTVAYRVEDYLEAGSLAAGTTGAAGPSGTAPALPSFACTCLAATDAAGRRVMGRNFDWERHPVLVLHTAPKEGYASLSLVDLHYLGYDAASDLAAAPEALRDAPRIPFDGLNEKGLAVGMMAVSHAEGVAGAAAGGGAGPRPRVDELGLIRLLLDRAADVEEALALAESVDVRFGSVPIHYFVADRGGASAVIEYLGGKARILRGEGGWQVSTNFLFAETPPASRAAACARYARATALLEAGEGRLGARGVFGLLAAVAQSNTTWSSAYDLAAGRLELALGGDFGKGFAFSLAEK